ncbi:hypothetical protein SLE2022_090970 [Rubroshorea leprosula]
MGGASLPPGFRFHPTDEELLGYYLKRKVEGLEIELEVIPVIDFYKFDPWELPEKSFLPKRDMEWFFFCPRDRKYPNGSRTNRATKAGYWKATGKDRKVVCQSGVTGYRKTLVFYRGRAPLGDRTDWVMHEYRICDDLSQGSPNQGAFALCRVVKRNEHAQKTSDSHGEPKSKRLGSSSGNGEFTSTQISNEGMSISCDISPQGSYPCYESRYSSPITSPHPYEVTQVAPFEHASMDSNPASFWVSPDLILDSSKDYPQVRETAPECFPQSEFPSSVTPWQQYQQTEFSPSSSYSNFGETEHMDDLSRIGCMSTYSGHANYMDFYGNEDIPSYDNTNPF